MERSWRLPALLIGLAAGNPAAAAGGIWPVNGHEYQVVVLSGPITWEDARAAAQALGPGWDLATIGSAEENNFVTSLLDPTLSERTHFWLGATDAATEGTWGWIDGTPFTYTNWWPAEPNNPGDTDASDFLAYDRRGGSWAWNDAASNENKLRGYVAERSVTSNVLDHFQCYKAKGEAPKVYVDLEDQFGIATVLVEQPEFFCNPVDKNGEGIRTPAVHLTCYKIEGESVKRDVLVGNQFGEQALEVRKPELLCVPSDKIEVDQ